MVLCFSLQVYVSMAYREGEKPLKVTSPCASQKTEPRMLYALEAQVLQLTYTRDQILFMLILTNSMKNGKQITIGIVHHNGYTCWNEGRHNRLHRTDHFRRL